MKGNLGGSNWEKINQFVEVNGAHANSPSEPPRKFLALDTCIPLPC